MTHDTAWGDVREQQPGLERVQILVGVPTFNHAGTVEPVIQAVVAGLRQTFPDAPALLMNADAGSQDGTPDAVKRAAGDALPVAVVRHRSGGGQAGVAAAPRLSESGVPGREEAFRAFFMVARQAGAAACLVVDAGVRSVTSDWVAWLVQPILDGRADYVAPVFARPRYEGSLTNSLIYPLSRALYGAPMRYHSGGGYGFSGAMAGLYLDRDLWTKEPVRYGIDSWLTTVAVAEGRALCQAGLGEHPRLAASGSNELSAVLARAVGSVFYFMERYEAAWERSAGSPPAPYVGLPSRPGPDRAGVNVERMITGFRQGLRDLLPIWEIILAPETLAGVLALGLAEPEDFRFPPVLWAQTVYDFALAYHEKVLHREHLLKALTPLYLGRTASLVLETRDAKPEDVEASTEELCETFARLKPYLIERWRFS